MNLTTFLILCVVILAIYYTIVILYNKKLKHPYNKVNKIVKTLPEYEISELYNLENKEMLLTPIYQPEINEAVANRDLIIYDERYNEMEIFTLQDFIIYFQARKYMYCKNKQILQIAISNNLITEEEINDPIPEDKDFILINLISQSGQDIGWFLVDKLLKETKILSSDLQNIISIVSNEL